MPGDNKFFQLEQSTQIRAKLNIEFYLDTPFQNPKTFSYVYLRSGNSAPVQTNGVEVWRDINDAVNACWNENCTKVSVKTVNNVSDFGTIATSRPAVWTNPFALQSDLTAPPVDTLERDTIARVIFYLGEGGCFSGSKLLPDLDLDVFSRFNISFFLPVQRVGYIFLNSSDAAADAFVHELGHVLGLSDRYFNALDDRDPKYIAPPDGPFIKTNMRKTIPMAESYINAILHQSGLGPDLGYDPQRNLMSSGLCNLSDFQRGYIQSNTFEVRYPQGVCALVAGKAPGIRPMVPPNSSGCRGAETRYYPAFPQDLGTLPGTAGRRLLFTTNTGAIGEYNARWRPATGTSPPLNSLLTGDKVLWNLIEHMKNDGFDGPTLNGLKQLTGIQ